METDYQLISTRLDKLKADNVKVMEEKTKLDAKIVELDPFMSQL